LKIKETIIMCQLLKKKLRQLVKDMIIYAIALIITNERYKRNEGHHKKNYQNFFEKIKI